jgi:hypothetical protein
MHKKWRVVYLGAVISALVVGLGLWSPLQAIAKNPNKAPLYMVDPFWPQPLPIDTEPNGASKPWVTGEVAATCIDSQDHLFTVNRGPQGNLVAPETQVAKPSPAVIEFDRKGNVVNAWPANVPTPGVNGGYSAPPSVPSGLHGCFVDYQDNVWIGGNGDGIVQKYSHDGSKLLLQIGKPHVCDNPPANTCGNSGANPAANKSRTLLNQPPDMAVDPSNGDIYIADGYGNHRIVVFDKNGTYLRQWGCPGTGPGQFQPTDGGHPHCVVLGKDGLVYACDRGSDRIQVFEKNPKNCKPCITPTYAGGEPLCQPVAIIPVIPGTGAGGLGTAGAAWDVAFSVDKDQTIMFDSDGGDEIVWEFDRAAALRSGNDCGPGSSTCSILAGFGRPGHMAGDFTFLHTIATDSKGNLFAGETINGRRVQRFELQGDVNEKKLEDFHPAGSPTWTLKHYDPRVPHDD